jgi:hypothetical protein
MLPRAKPDADTGSIMGSQLVLWNYNVLRGVNFNSPDRYSRLVVSKSQGNEGEKMSFWERCSQLIPLWSLKEKKEKKDLKVLDALELRFPIKPFLAADNYLLGRKCNSPGYRGINDMFKPITFIRIASILVFFCVKWEKCYIYGQGDAFCVCRLSLPYLQLTRTPLS